MDRAHVARKPKPRWGFPVGWAVKGGLRLLCTRSRSTRMIMHMQSAQKGKCLEGLCE